MLSVEKHKSARSHSHPWFRYFNCFVLCIFLFIGCDLAVTKTGVRKSIPKWEEWFDFSGIEPSVTHQNIFLVILIDAVAGIGEFSKRVCRIVFELHREREWQLTRWIYSARNDPCNGITVFGAVVPVLYYSGNFFYPWHCYRIAGSKYDDQVFIHFQNFADEAVLSKR